MIFNIIIVFFLVSLLIVLIYHLRSSSTRSNKNLIEELSKLYNTTKLEVGNLKTEINEKVSQLDGRVIDILQKNSHDVASRFEVSNKVFGELKSSISQINESNKNILSMGANIVELQNILRAPKPRGSLGEVLLEDLLGQIFPAGLFKMQHSFKKAGTIVDAVIKLQEGLVPIDAKFPLEYFNKMLASSEDDKEKENRKNFIKMVKRHITDISEKYIIPSEDTLEFAIMYIPAENVYYEAIVRDEAFGESNSVLQFAINKKVIPVSPNTFYAYLQTLLFGLKGLKIEQEAKTIMQNLSKIGKDLTKFEDNFNQVGRNLDKAKNSFNTAQERWSFFSRRFDSILKVEDKTNFTENELIDENEGSHCN